MAQSTLTSLFLSFRPKTLTAAIIPVMVATALAFQQNGQVNWWVVFWALCSALFIQIGTNLINDWSDFRKGADTEERIGPARATQQGWMSPKTVFQLGLLSLALALLFGAPLVVIGGWPIIVVGLLSLVFAYAYTAGPYPLAYLGLGDIFVILFFGIVAVTVTFFLHTGSWSFSAIWLGLQIGFLATVLLAINNLRDVEQDKKANKRTLAVRFGRTFARVEIALLLLVPFIMNLYFLSQDLQWAFLLPLFILPRAARLSRQIWNTPPSAIYNQFLAQAAMVHVKFGVLVGLGLII